MLVKEAADRMLSDGRMTKEQYEALETLDLMEKGAADIRGIGTAIKEWALPIGALLTGSLLAKQEIVDPLIQASKVKKSFEAMQKKTPQLAEKDQDQVRDYFSVVKTFSPKSASNPLVAGALVNKMMEFGGVDHKLVQDLSSIESGFARPRISQSVAEGAAKALTGAKVGKEDM